MALLTVFLFCAGSVVYITSQYKNDERLYFVTANQYTQQRIPQENSIDETTDEVEMETAPISVDFEGLQAANSDIIGWIYCEDTPINYPVLQAGDNNAYLRHNYEGEYSTAGSIFIDAANRPGLVDSNTIIYGHHMRNGSMFACLDQWEDQEFYEEHPVMWLLTPEQDYKIVLFSSYGTSAYSDTYTIFTGPCEELNEYLENSVRQSDFKADVEMDPEGRYVLLTTCAYMFENARYVIHGMLIPVGSQQTRQTVGQ